MTIRLATETSRMRAGAAAAGGDDMLSGTACSDGAGGKVCSLEDVMSVMGAGEGALAHSADLCAVHGQAGAWLGRTLT